MKYLPVKFNVKLRKRQKLQIFHALYVPARITKTVNQYGNLTAESLFYTQLTGK
jgi:hypothetical protein